MKVKKLIALLLVFILVTATFAACSASSADTSDTSSSSANNANTDSNGSSDSQPVDGKDTLYIGQIQALSTFQHGTFGGFPTLISLVFDNLFWVDPETGEYVSDILSDWYYEDDLTFVMTVNDGIYFNNGEQLTAEDILYTFQSYFIKESPFVTMLTSMDLDNSSVSDDGMTLTLKWQEAFSPGVFIMPYPIISKVWCEANGWDSQDWYDNPCGSGPYKVVEFVTDSYVKFELRDDYADAADYPYQYVVAKYYGEASTMYIDLESGALDLALGVNATDYDRAVSGQSENIAATTTKSGYFTIQCWNTCLNEYTADANVRKALNEAVDWVSLSEAVYGSLGIPQDSAVMSCSKYYDDSIHMVTYDPEDAKALLEAAGVKDGDIVLSITTTSDNEDYVTALQSYLAAVGVTLTVDFVDFATMQQILVADTSPETLLITACNASSGQPYGYLTNMIEETSSYPHNFVADETFRQLVNDCLKTVDEDELKALYSELAQNVADNNWYMPYVQMVSGICFNTTVIQDAQFMDTLDSMNLRNIVYAN